MPEIEKNSSTCLYDVVSNLSISDLEWISLTTNLSPGVDDSAVLHHQGVGVELLPPQGRQHEGGAVAVLPVHNSPDSLSVHVGGVVLGPDEAVLYQPVGERVDPVPVSSPGENLQPAGDGRSSLFISSRHLDGVEGRVGESDSLQPGVDGP